MAEKFHRLAIRLMVPRLGVTESPHLAGNPNPTPPHSRRDCSVDGPGAWPASLPRWQISLLSWQISSLIAYGFVTRFFLIVLVLRI